MVQELIGLAGETASGGEGKVCGNEEVGKIFVGDFAGEGAVVAGWACWFENSLVVGRDPGEFEDSAFHVRVGGAKVVDGGVGFGDSRELSQVET
jgi:hypothetical protein